MDRVSLRRRRDGAEVAPTADGWVLDAEIEWLLEGAPEVVARIAAALDGIAQPLTADLLLLRFGNAVGRFDAGPAGLLIVRSGKWTDQHYADMLSDIAGWSAALPFQAGAPSALPYARTELDASDVLYHAFVWLRHAVLESPDGALLGALRAILRDPHRRMVAEERVVPAHQVSRVSQRALDEVAAGLRPFRRVPLGRGLGGGALFPTELAEQITTPSVDTAENRFVRAFLASCVHVVEAMRARCAGDPSGFGRRVRADCAAIEGELTAILSHRLWAEVGPMHLFPSASTVLHRRPAYREVLRHHILMRMGTRALPLDASEVRQLLEVKNIAKLYELWTVFAVIDAVRQVRGPPHSAERIRDDRLSASLGAGLVARWPDGTAVAYDASYTHEGGFHGRSWSLNLRPDVALWSPSGPARGLHLFDAKFKVVGSLNGDGPVDSRTDDLHKMHAYRDAIREARSAWVMYPGTRSCHWPDPDAPAGGVTGVGSIPVVPGEDHRALRALVARMLGLGLPGQLQRSA